MLKLFNPVGHATRLFFAMEPDGDALNGLCNIGFGEPEMGYMIMSELLKVSRMLPIGLKRNLSFQATRWLSMYAGEATASGRIIA